jgi:YidC/Oxa1 family membrane protein insertase
MVFLSNYFVDFGTVIIATTIIIKFIIYPLYSGQIRNTIATKKAQPELKEIQKKLKDKSLDQFKRQELMMEMMKVNKKYGVKILTPILSIIFQITITIALY